MKKSTEEVKKMSYSERGLKGAIALNSDPEKKKQAAKKATETRKAINPDFFREIGRLGGLATRKKKG